MDLFRLLQDRHQQGPWRKDYEKERERERERMNESKEQREMERKKAREKGTPRQCQQDDLEDSLSSPGKIFRSKLVLKTFGDLAAATAKAAGTMHGEEGAKRGPGAHTAKAYSRRCSSIFGGRTNLLSRNTTCRLENSTKLSHWKLRQQHLPRKIWTKHGQPRYLESGRIMRSHRQDEADSFSLMPTARSETKDPNLDIGTEERDTKLEGLRLRVQGLGLRVEGLGCRVQG